jgi:serine/threonine protein kinase
MKKEQTSRDYVRLDWGEVQKHRLRKELTAAELKEEASLTNDSWSRIKNGRPIGMGTAVRVRIALGVKDLFALLHPETLVKLASWSDEARQTQALPDWQPIYPLCPEITASNDLKYQIWRLEHCFEEKGLGEKRLARGKRYNLALIRTEEQRRVQHYLLRHATICNRLAGHAHIPKHVTTVQEPGKEAWWVVDEWTEGRPLAETLIYEEPIRSERLPIIMRGIAEGLRALHEKKIIRRELSPRFVILTDADEVVLTDFELGQLFDGSPTVSANWPDDIYRAPEVGGQDLRAEDVHVDLYSWGRILVHAATGSLPPRGKEAEHLEQSGLPRRVVDIAKRCVALVYEDRPRSIAEVLSAIRRWK